MINIDAKKVIETRIAESMGFDKYKQIMEMVRKTDVSSDPDFQRTFNGFIGSAGMQNGGRHIMTCSKA